MVECYLNPREATAYIKRRGLPCAVSTLAKRRCLGGGPEYFRFGRNIVHTPAQLDAWIAKRLGEAKANTCEVSS